MLFGGNRSIAIGLSVNPAGVRAGLAVARKEMSDFARQGVETATRHRRSWDGVADGLGKAGLAAGAFAAVAVVSFAKFDKSMSRAAAGTEATASELTALRAAALKAGADTQFSATQAADAITEMGKAGVSVKDILGGGLTGTLSLAAAGELEVARAAEIGATALMQFGLAGNQLPHVADVLAAGAGKAQGSVEDLAQALKFVGPVSNNLGVSLEETTGTLALFAEQGIIGEQAGTSMRGMLLSLTSPSAKAAELMKELGINLYDAQGRFIGVSGVAGELAEGMAGLTDAQRNAALGVIFGNEQVTAATVLYKGGATAVNEWTKTVDDAGFAARQSAQLMDNLAGDVEQLKGSLETAFIGAGSGGNEGLRTLTQAARQAVDAFNGLPPGVQKSTVVVAGVGAASLLATAGVLKLVSATVAARANLATLGVTAGTTRASLLALGRLGTVAAGFAALGYAGSQFVDSAEEAAVKAGLLQKALSDLGEVGRTVEAVGSFGRNFEELGRGLRDLADPSLERRFKDFHNTISGFVTFGQVGSSAGTRERAQLIEDLRRTDEALAGLVASGNVDEAKRQFEALNTKAIEGGAGVDQLARHLPAYQDALKGAAASGGAAAGATGEFTRGVVDLKTAAEDAKRATDELAAAAVAYTNDALGARGSARDYEAAIDAATAALAENGRTLDITTEKGRENQAALDGIASSGAAQAESTLKQTGSMEKFRAVLGRTRDDLVKAARRFGLTRAQAEEYADSVLKIPSKAETQLLLRGVDSALEKLGIIRQTMARINGETVTVTVRQSGEVNIGRGGRVARAGGGILPGPPSRTDNMLIAAASGEFVVNARQTARHRPLLEAINDGTVRGFASGGYVALASSKRPRSRMLVEDVVESLGGAVAWSTQRVQSPVGSVSAAPSRQGRGESPLVQVQQLHLVEGTPEQVGSEIMFAVRAAGG